MAIATFAVLQDSTAVVIGAMLVAPLMTPILGLSAALVNGWRRRSGRSLLQVVLGVAVSVAIGRAVLLAAGGRQLRDEQQITSRVSPTFLDMLIAIAAGAAGAFATIDRRVTSPSPESRSWSHPAAAVRRRGQPRRRTVRGPSGAALLFATNFVAIGCARWWASC